MNNPEEAANWRKSLRSYSSGGCVEAANWRKPRRSMNNGNCAEAASAGAVILVRDTKDRDGFTLAVDANAWRAFTDGIKGGAA